MEKNVMLHGSCPEWYKHERETEKSIQRLTTMRELSFYLLNEDSFIRRLAILRINTLVLKDAVDPLRELITHPDETQNNKNLAAWTIKRICLKQDVDLFVSDKLLNKYTGNEKMDEIIQVRVFDDVQNLKFEFPPAPLEEVMNNDNQGLRMSDGIDLDMPFPYDEWVSALKKGYVERVISGLKRVPGKMLAITMAVFAGILFVLKAIGSGIKKAAGLVARMTRRSNSGVPQGSVDRSGSAGRSHPPVRMSGKMQKTMLIGLEEAEQAQQGQQGQQGQADATDHADTGSASNAAGIAAAATVSRTGLYDSQYDKNELRRSLMSSGRDRRDSEKYYRRERRNYIGSNGWRVRENVLRILRSRVTAVIGLVLLYYFVTFSGPGKALVFQCFGVNLQEVQAVALSNGSRMFSSALRDIQVAVGLYDPVEEKRNEAKELNAAAGKLTSATTTAVTAQAVPQQKYTVAMSNGAGLRTQPGEGSPRVDGRAVKYGEEVVLQPDGKQADAAGKAWLKVKTGDGRVGWLAERWLKEVSKNGNS